MPVAFQCHHHPRFAHQMQPGGRVLRRGLHPRVESSGVEVVAAACEDKARSGSALAIG
jgi:hypothetical protein